MKTVISDKKSSNSTSNSSNFKIGNLKENNSEHLLREKQDKLMNGKLELVDLKNK